MDPNSKIINTKMELGPELSDIGLVAPAAYSARIRINLETWIPCPLHLLAPGENKAWQPAEVLTREVCCPSNPKIAILVA